MIKIISSSRYKINRKQLKKNIEKLVLERGIGENNNINIVFVGKIKMKNVSQKYKKEEGPLPILTFKYDEQQAEGKLLGEIIICYPQVLLLAAERNKMVDETILRLVDHGLKNLSA
jgi:ssRNA-specific RNase YbeY (16S rRNA maturation enzyme)